MKVAIDAPFGPRSGPPRSGTQTLLSQPRLRRCFKTGRDIVSVDAKLALPDLEGQYQSVTIRATVGNNGYIYVGRVGVTWETGFQLAPGTEIALKVDNLNSIYVVANRADQVYCWLVN